MSEIASEVHEALKGYLDEGEILIGWTTTMEIALPDGGGYLAHRHGGGIDGLNAPSLWTALGMLRTAVLDCETQLRSFQQIIEDDEDEEAPE